MIYKRRSQTRKIVVGVLLISVFITLLFVHAWVRTNCITIGYMIPVGQKETASLLSEQQQLKIRIAQLRAPNRIIAVARDKFGLQMPTDDQIVIIETKKRL